MTRPRISTERKLFGIVGVIPERSTKQANWNAFFDKENIDAFIDHYPTVETDLPERLSEMFHFDRRGYIIGEEFQEVILPMLDSLDSSASERKRVDTVWNDNGVLRGYFLEGSQEDRWKLWCKK